jgi:hypothetical protein
MPAAGTSSPARLLTPCPFSGARCRYYADKAFSNTAGTTSKGKYAILSAVGNAAALFCKGGSMQVGWVAGPRLAWRVPGAEEVPASIAADRPLLPPCC